MLSWALRYCEEWVRRWLLSSKALLDVLRTYTVMTPRSLYRSDMDVDGRGEMVSVVSAPFLPQELVSDYFSILVSR